MIDSGRHPDSRHSQGAEFNLGEGFPHERGARVSDRQWRDQLGVVRVNREALDREYLDRQAAANGLSELLARLLAEADPP
jgi:hypothetical protein